MDRAPQKLPNNASRLIAMAMNLGATEEELRQLMQCSALEWTAYRAGHLKPSMAQLDPLVGYIVARHREAIENARKLIGQARKDTKPDAD